MSKNAQSKVNIKEIVNNDVFKKSDCLKYLS